MAMEEPEQLDHEQMLACIHEQSPYPITSSSESGPQTNLE
jgi:hypothetical protein